MRPGRSPIPAYANAAFLADPGAAYGREWFDADGWVTTRSDAVEVRFFKRPPKGAVLVGRFTIAEARAHGLIREGGS